MAIRGGGAGNFKGFQGGGEDSQGTAARGDGFEMPDLMPNA